MPTDRKDPTEQEILIEEKKTKPNGEVYVRKYIKGRFLGKVRYLQSICFKQFPHYKFQNYREGLQNDMNSHEQKLRNYMLQNCYQNLP